MYDVFNVCMSWSCFFFNIDDVMVIFGLLVL